MRGFLVAIATLLQFYILVAALPIITTGQGSLSPRHSYHPRASSNSAQSGGNAKSTTGTKSTASTKSAGGSTAAASSKQQTQVTNAASNFAKDVSVVSNSLNSLGTTTDPNQVRQLARQAFTAETDEDQQRAVLNQAAGSTAKQANQKIVDNTPIVLNGLKSIMQNPSTDNTMKSLQTIESSRNKNILPSITTLSNSAFQQTGINQKAKTFQPTTGTQNLKQLQASKANN